MGFRIACLTSCSSLVVLHIRRDCPVAPQSCQVMICVTRERQRSTCVTNLFDAVSTVSESTTSEGRAIESTASEDTVSESTTSENRVRQDTAGESIVSDGAVTGGTVSDRACTLCRVVVTFMCCCCRFS